MHLKLKGVWLRVKKVEAHDYTKKNKLIPLEFNSKTTFSYSKHYISESLDWKSIAEQMDRIFINGSNSWVHPFFSQRSISLPTAGSQWYWSCPLKLQAHIHLWTTEGNGRTRRKAIQTHGGRANSTRMQSRRWQDPQLRLQIEESASLFADVDICEEYLSIDCGLKFVKTIIPESYKTASHSFTRPLTKGTLWLPSPVQYHCSVNTAVMNRLTHNIFYQPYITQHIYLPANSLSTDLIPSSIS